MPDRTRNRLHTPTPSGDACNAALREFIRSSPYPYLIMDESGGIVKTNPAFTQMLQCAPGALDGTPFVGIIAPECRNRYFETFRDFCAGRHQGEFPLTLLRRGDSALSVQMQRQTDLIADTGTRHIIIAVRDCMEETRITERVARITEQIERKTGERIRALENELKEREEMATAFRDSQERQSLAFWGANMAWWDYDLVSNQIAASPRISTILGGYYTMRDMTREDFLGHIHPDEQESVRDAFNAHVSGTTPIINLQLRLRTEEGAWKWVSLRGRTTEFDAKQQPLRIIGIIQDISDAKLTEAEHELFFNHSADMFTILGMDGVLRQVNPACLRSLGWQPSEMIGRDAIIFTHPEDRGKGEAALDSLMAGEAPALVEQRILCKDGTYRWLSTRAVPLPEHDIIIGIGRDITKQKKMDEQIRLLNQTLEQRVQERSAALQQTLDESHALTTELQHQKAYLSDAMSLGQIAYWEYDTDNAEFIVNDAFYTLMRTDVEREGGYRINATVFQKRFLASHDVESLANCMANVPNTDPDILYGFEMPVQFGDGTAGYAIIRIRMDRDEAGAVTRMYGIAQDITAQKAMKTDVDRQELMYRTLFETAPSPIFVADAQTGILVDANHCALAFSGLTLDEVRTMHFSQLHDDSTRDLARQMFERMCHTTKLESALLHLRHHDGGYRLVNVVGAVFRCAEHSYAFGIMHDIQAQKEQGEMFLKQSGHSQ